MLVKLHIIKSLRWLSVVLLAMVSTPALASVSFNSQTMLENMSFVLQILQDFSILAGLWLIMTSFFRFKKYSEGRSMMMQQSIATPLMMLLGGTFLLYLPTMLGTALLNFWGYVQPLQPNLPSFLDGFGPSMRAILMMLRVVGVYIFIKGIMKLSKSGKENGQPGMVGKGLMSIFIGILLVHIMGTVHIVEQLVGVTIS